ncbi:hypothetical protein M3J09_003678 [Ascochyta lentis]
MASTPLLMAASNSCAVTLGGSAMLGS